MQQNYTYNDQELLSSLREGNQLAFNMLYEKHWENVYNQAFKKLHDPALAKDITQEVFIFIWVNREKNDINNLDAYLFSAVRNNIFRFLKQESRFLPLSDLIMEVKAHYPAADAAVIEAEFYKQYQAILETMPAAQQNIFKMRYEDDLSTLQIAEKLNISRKTVQNQLTRAVSMLKASLLVIAAAISQIPK